MKKGIALALLMSSISVVADDISNYKHYQIDSNISDGKGPFYAVYIKNDNPCIIAKNFKDASTTEYCKMGNSGLDLKRDHQSIYPADLTISALTLSFIVAAPWNEQKCEVFLPKKSITCESTGR